MTKTTATVKSLISFHRAAFNLRRASGLSTASKWTFRGALAAVAIFAQAVELGTKTTDLTYQTAQAFADPAHEGTWVNDLAYCITRGHASAAPRKTDTTMRNIVGIVCKPSAV